MKPDNWQALERTRQLLEQLFQNKQSWMAQQDMPDITPLTLEEAYELTDAVDAQNPQQVRDELGDLFIHLLVYAHLGSALGWFNLTDIANSASEKLLRRHPSLGNAGAQDPNWEQIKRKERADAGQDGLFDNIGGLPALVRTIKVQQRAAQIGFDWKSIEGPRAKVSEELAEVDEQIQGTGEGEGEREREREGEGERLQHEIGDLLLACTNLARHLQVNPEQALHQATHRFQRRVERVTELLGDRLEHASEDELEDAWRQAKASE